MTFLKAVRPLSKRVVPFNHPEFAQETRETQGQLRCLTRRVGFKRKARQSELSILLTSADASGHDASRGAILDDPSRHRNAVLRRTVG